MVRRRRVRTSHHRRDLQNRRHRVRHVLLLFSTKSAVLVAILEYGTPSGAGVVRRPAGTPRHTRSALGVRADEYADERVAGFIHAVVAVMGEPDIAAALAADVDAVQNCSDPLGRDGPAAEGAIRDNLTPVRATRWLMVLLDGFLDRIISEPDFTVATEKPTLLDAVARLLAPSPTERARWAIAVATSAGRCYGIQWETTGGWRSL